MADSKHQVITTHEEFIQFAASERKHLEDSDDNILYTVKVKTDIGTISEILKTISTAKERGTQSHKRFVDSLLLFIYASTKVLKSLEAGIKSKDKDCIIIKGIDKTESSQVLIYSPCETIHPLIPHFLALQDWNIIVQKISVNISAALIKLPEKASTLEVNEASDIMDITVFHKYLLLSNKFANKYKIFEIDIYMPYASIDNKERLMVLIANLDHNKVKVYLTAPDSQNPSNIKRTPITSGRKINYGMLFPAVYIKDIDDYFFLKLPIRKELWDGIRSKVPLEVQEQEKIFLAYMYVCKRSLFSEFDDSNKSKEYTKLRREAYSSDLFYEKYVSKIPFLALFLFALYDNHYRNESLRQFKDRIHSNSQLTKSNFQLTKSDCLLSHQGEQDRKRYEIYKNIRKEYDIKNLIDYTDEESNQFVFQNTVDAEMFECISIAEGLLQICENAVLHADGGLLSMRIYNRSKGVLSQEPIRPQNVKYLDEIYGKSYFEYLNSSFFLEVQLSDFSESSMPEKFIENIRKYAGISEEFKRRFSKYLTPDDDGFDALKRRIKLDFFFADHKPDGIYNANDEKQLPIHDFKKWYYSLSKSVVHHYGLETFNAILSAKNGIFSVCGNNDYYSNVDDIVDRAYKKIVGLIKYKKETPLLKDYAQIFSEIVEEKKNNEKQKLKESLGKDKSLPGAVYRILLPLNHNRTTNYKVGNMSEKKGEIIPINYDLVRINNGTEKMYLNSKDIKEKQEKIDEFAKYITQGYYEKKKELLREKRDKKTLLITCIDAQSLQMPRPADFFESMIKGILRFALDLSTEETNSCFPISIVNLTPFEFIEAARIIAIFYTRESLFEKVPIYLKCLEEDSEPSKTITFSGTDAQSVRDNILRTAMKSGTMFDELYVIISILNNHKLQAEGEL